MIGFQVGPDPVLPSACRGAFRVARRPGVSGVQAPGLNRVALGPLDLGRKRVATTPDHPSAATGRIGRAEGVTRR